ncbi:LacI family DNA-binding transcriptional regulator [Jidongwangia harbinensis]|uniref:LacI family DNA-binding transcriptional regulator n=1 Tax=Jidongwangia harbinensis TaxID=2878561 RepID=UPI001CD9ADBB|nr:LacI family DNA-binding transcriptional regulator [Jidongwangia harbinensis]MCA2213153.1 LacI family transcriptional regulator [Jidongwangia harbinensis]
MAVTIKDVARLAGVSPATVCRALSTPERVKTETRERVRRAVDDLGYSPNRAARGLITGRTGNIGLVVPDLANPFFPGVVKGIQARAREADYSVFVADTDEDPSAEASLVRSLGKQVDGLVLCSPRMSEEDLRSVVGDTPLVLLNRRVDQMPAITFDSLGGMRQAIAHLMALGHRRIAYVGGPRTSWSNRDRLNGLRTVTAAAGADLVEVGNVLPQFSGGVAAADLVLAAEATAVVAYNDVVALGLISRFAARSISVPDRLSVIGFDDISMSAMVHPSLTTVALPMELSGRAGVDLLLQLMQHPDQSGTSRELETHLMVRGSTGPAPRI